MTPMTVAEIERLRRGERPSGEASLAVEHEETVAA
jgi:hypothetical protein